MVLVYIYNSLPTFTIKRSNHPCMWIMRNAWYIYIWYMYHTLDPMGMSRWEFFWSNKNHQPTHRSHRLIPHRRGFFSSASHTLAVENKWIVLLEPYEGIEKQSPRESANQKYTPWTNSKFSLENTLFSKKTTYFQKQNINFFRGEKP